MERRMPTGLQFDYEETEYSVKEFFLKFKDDLPQLVMVTQGYCGDRGIDVIDNGQAIRIQTFSRQKRLVAKVLKGEDQFNSKNVSIPLDYNVRFHVVKQPRKRSSKEYPLREIVDKYSLPVVVEYVGSKETKGEKSGRGLSWDTRSFSFHLVDMYDEIYLLGYPVTESHVFVRHMAVPVYLKSLRLSIIRGMKGYTSGWSSFLKALDDRIHQHVQFNRHFGNEDIAVYDEHVTDESERTYVEPREYSEVSMTLRRKESGHVYEKMEAPNTYEAIYSDTDIKPALVKPDGREPEKIRYSPFPSGQQNKTNQEDTSQQRRTVPQPGQQNKRPPPLPPKRYSAKAKQRSLSLDQDIHHKDDTRSDPTYTNLEENASENPQTTVKSNETKDTAGDIFERAETGDVTLYTREMPQEKAREDAEQNVAQLPDREPPVINTLSVSEVCQWLDRLNLGKYIPMFNENIIDGELLTDLTEDILTSDFEMKRFEAIKLRKFVQEGYIPKL